MDSSNPKPHVVCIPLPAQGHINPMLKLAKLLHSKGFFITFVHTEFNHNILVAAVGGASMEVSGDFRFQTVADGLPESNRRGILDLPELCRSLPVHCLKSFRDLVGRIKNGSEDSPPVSCIVSDGVMSFTMKVAEEFGIPEYLFFTPSVCGVLGYLQYAELLERGLFPSKDESCLSNGYLDKIVDWVPAMRGMRLKDLPTFIRTTDIEDTMFNYNLEAMNVALKAGRIILNTFDDLEREVLDEMRGKFASIYTIGPLSLLQQEYTDSKMVSVESNLWKEDGKCLEWLDKKEDKSVVYVNFGSLVTITCDQLSEFAWGLANTKYSFLWILRPDSVDGGTTVVSDEFLNEIEGRGLVLGWCPKEKVLGHRAVGGFLTHCGWNSTLESISEGIPMVCWPFFAEQQTNCYFLCNRWGIGLEVDEAVKREEVEGLVMELMEGRKAEEMREKALEWKKRAQMATTLGGTSYMNFNVLAQHIKNE